MSFINVKVIRYILLTSFFVILVVLNNQKALAAGSLPFRGYIDSPLKGTIVKGNYNVSGWFLDKSGVSKIEVLVDGKSMGEAQYGLSRADVYRVFPDYQNLNSGYHFTLATKNLTNGPHTITVREIGNNGATNDLPGETVNVQNPPPIGSIDSPANGAAIKDSVAVNGWFLDYSGVSKVEVLVDGKSVGRAQYNDKRPDVKAAFPAYQNANSGYRFTLSTKNLTNGQHTLSVRETGRNGGKNTLNETVKVQNSPPIGSIDTPTSGSPIKDNVHIYGWALDYSGVATVDILVDGKVVGQAQYGNVRPDVQQVYPQYGVGKSGYEYTLATKNLTNGPHVLTVRETGNNGGTNVLQSEMVIVENPPTGFAAIVTNSKTAQKTDQIVTVVGSGTTAEVTLWEKAYNQWGEVFSTSGFVGSAGIGHASEGSEHTPEGAYTLGFAFGKSNPGTQLPFRQITPNSYWISNVNSNLYNTWQEGNFAGNGNEHLANYENLQYYYAIVINYNMGNIVRGAGSAFFLHVSNGHPTAGCVAVPMSYMEQFMKRIHPGAYIINATSENEVANY